MRKVSIIMPVRNNKQETKDAIMSIINNTEYKNYELIIVESESDDGTAEMCDKLSKKYPIIKVYHTKKEGITKAINFGILHSDKTSDIYLTQNDVIHPNLYRRDWLTVLVNIRESKDNIGLITTLYAGGIDEAGDYLKNLRWVGTWSMYIPRETINNIGLFDEQFSPGPGDDVDYSYRVQKAKLKIAVVDLWVDHHRTCHQYNDSFELGQKAAAIFRKKHFKTERIDYIVEPNKKLKLDLNLECDYGTIHPKKYIWDIKTVNKINNICKDFNDDDIFIDCGAHIGEMSILIEKGMCYAVEPGYSNYEKLCNNITINNKHNIIPINRALYDEEILYSMITEIPTGNSNIRIGTGNRKTNIGDTLFKRVSNEKKIKLIKIDCENTSFSVLKGFENIIKKHKPILILESRLIPSEYINKLNYEIVDVFQENIECHPK
jgi:FkbM family methyltransferase